MLHDDRDKAHANVTLNHHEMNMVTHNVCLL